VITQYNTITKRCAIFYSSHCSWSWKRNTTHSKTTISQQM